MSIDALSYRLRFTIKRISDNLIANVRSLSNDECITY